MANQEHLKILLQGVDVWNQWRKDNPHINPDLSKANLFGTDLEEADLSFTDLRDTDLRRAGLLEANLWGADLGGADLEEADLRGAHLGSVKFYNTDFKGSELAYTIFGFTDLSQAKNLETCVHYGPSIIDYDTLTRSKSIPRAFLKGIGLPDLYIDYLPSLLEDPLHFYSCFIAYTKSDDEFSQKLHNNLQEAGIRCWRWPEDLKIGQTMMREIDHAIRKHDKLIVILSKESLKSQPVQDEITRAIQKERNLRKRNPRAEVVFPVRLDNYILSHHCKYHHAADLKAKRIGDFRNWKDHDSYQKEFQLLLKTLEKEPKEKKGIKAKK